MSMHLAPSVFFPHLERLIASPAMPEPNAAMAALIGACEASYPHDDWAALRAIDYGAELPSLRAWFDRTLEREPPAFPLRAFYFELCHPVPSVDDAARAAHVEAMTAARDRLMAATTPAEQEEAMAAAMAVVAGDGHVTTADLSLSGFSAYDRADPERAWLSSEMYLPRSYAGSRVLHAMYGIAYGTYESGADLPQRLGNDAEWPISLAYAALAVRSILEGRTSRDVPADASHVGVTADWSGGDALFIGELTPSGFVPGPARGVPS